MKGASLGLADFVPEAAQVPFLKKFAFQNMTHAGDEALVNHDGSERSEECHRRFDGSEVDAGVRVGPVNILSGCMDARIPSESSLFAYEAYT